MQVFVSVVEAGSISAAAERLDLAKSAVSRRLAELEAHLGVSLITRTTRRLNLTDSGRAYYARCVAILADLDEAESAVSQAHAALKGKLKLALPLSFGLLHLSPLIQAFMTLHPEVRFELDFNDRQIDLMQEGFDLAIRIATLEDSSLIARRLAPIRHVVCASPDYLAKHGTPVAAADLAASRRPGLQQLARSGSVVLPQPGRTARPGARAGAPGRQQRRFSACAPPSPVKACCCCPVFMSTPRCARGNWCACWPITAGRNSRPTRCIRPPAICRTGCGP